MEEYDWVIELLGTIVGVVLLTIILVRLLVAFRYWRTRRFYKLRLVPKEEIDLSATIDQEYKLYYGKIQVTEIPFTQDKNDYSVPAYIELTYSNDYVERWYIRRATRNGGSYIDPKSRVYDKENTRKEWDTIAIIYTPEPVSEECMSVIASMDSFYTGQVTFLSGPQWFCKARIFMYGFKCDIDIRDLLYIDWFNVNEEYGARIRHTFSDKWAQYPDEEETNNN